MGSEWTKDILIVSCFSLGPYVFLSFIMGSPCWYQEEGRLYRFLFSTNKPLHYLFRNLFLRRSKLPFFTLRRMVLRLNLYLCSEDALPGSNNWLLLATAKQSSLLMLTLPPSVYLSFTTVAFIYDSWISSRLYLWWRWRGKNVPNRWISVVVQLAENPFPSLNY